MAEKKLKKKGTNDFKWWNYQSSDTYFTISTHDKYSFAPGQQIFTSYGRRSNKFLLIFYGFCIPNNKHDSIMIRIKRKIDRDAKMGST